MLVNRAMNEASGSYSTVAGGYVNTASGDASVITGGNRNTVAGGHAIIGGGWCVLLPNHKRMRL